MIFRTITCDMPNCKNSCIEENQNSGWPGWGHIGGVSLNGIPQPNLCPEHLGKIMEFIDGGLNGLDNA